MRPSERGVCLTQTLHFGAGSCRSVQKIVTMAFNVVRTLDDTEKVLQKRMWKLTHSPLPPLALEGMSRVLRQLPPIITIAACRAIFDAWPTSVRFQRDPLPCLFGCPAGMASDDLVHYIACPRLWHMIKVATPDPPPATSPAERLLCGYPSASPHIAAQLALATRTYLTVALSPELADKVPRPWPLGS